MKSVRILFVAGQLLLPAIGFAQAPGDKHESEMAKALETPAAQQWFEQIKTLAGTWQGAVTTDPAVPQMAGDVLDVTMRVTSMGNAFMHNARSSRRPDDPLTMIYLENDRLMLTHYCDSGNRPRMEATVSPDGRIITFEFVDLVGPTKHGHMNRAVFTFLDADHHVEEWTYVMPNGAEIRVRSDLRRVQPAR